MPIRRHGAVMVAEDTLKKLGLFVGDVVCLTSFNGKTTKAIVVLESDLPEKTIRADKELRVNLDVSVGSWITASAIPADCLYALKTRTKSVYRDINCTFGFDLLVSLTDFGTGNVCLCNSSDDFAVCGFAESCWNTIRT